MIKILKKLKMRVTIEENVENVENEIVKTENENKQNKNNSEGSSEPDVVDAVGSRAVHVTGAGARVDIENESNSEDEIFEDANYYDSDSEFSNTAQDLNKLVMLCQTVSIQNENVNICYDYGAAFSMLKEKKANVALLKGKGRQVCRVVPGVPIDERARVAQTMPLATVPIPLAGGGGVGAANVYIISEKLPPMSIYPLPSEVAQVFNLPPSDFARRGGGAVELDLGADNIQYFPCRVGSKNNKDMSLVLYESRLQGGLVYGGSVSSGWKSKVSMSRNMPMVMSVLGLMMALLFCFAAPAQAFVAYDCVNGSNVVEAYSLLEPAQCSVSGFEHRYERFVNVKIVQQKRERTVSIFQCHVVESVFSQYCGHSSAAGVTRYIRFREPLLVEPETCRRAQQTDGNITINGRVFQGNVGTTTSHSFFLAGGLDSGHHCSRDTLRLGDGGKHDYQAAQTVLEVILTEEYAKINELTGKIRLPGDLVARAADKSI
jgi:hypothetical protein